MKATVIRNGKRETYQITRFEISNYYKKSGYVVLYNPKNFPNDITHIDIKDLLEVAITEDVK